MVRLPEYVVFDLETIADRPAVAEHEIIQIGAVLASGDGIVDEFDTFVRPVSRGRLPDRVTELTGITFGDLEHAPSLGDSLRRFFDWVADRPMIAHNGLGYDFIVLDAAVKPLGLAVPNGPRLDTLELAHVVHPRAGPKMIKGVDGAYPPRGRKLDQLAALIGRSERDKHEALNDARIAREVMMSLLEELNSPAPARQLQRWVLGRADHPWTAFVDQQEDQVPLENVVPAPPVEQVPDPTGQLDVGAIAAKFGEGGQLTASGLQPRPQQAHMGELVAKTLVKPNGRQMIEAPTGTGKTYAYLVPAIEAARASGRVSVVAPHSRVLQDQILQDLEALKSVLEPFSTVVLKGRNNYISLPALDDELRLLATPHAELMLDLQAGEAGAAAAVGRESGGTAADPPDATSAPRQSDSSSKSEQDRAMSLAILCGWVAKTPTGDWADLRTTAVESRLGVLKYLRWRLRVQVLPGPPVTAVDERDFYRRASNRLDKSHVAVVNHALLASGPDISDGSFNVIVDEAHNLEDSVTAAATLEVTVEQLERLCDALWNEQTGSGLLSRLAAIRRDGLSDGHIMDAVSAVRSARRALTSLSEPLVEYVRTRTGLTREQASRWGASYRIRRGESRRDAYQSVIAHGRALRDGLQAIAAVLDEIDVPIEPLTRYRQRALEDEKARLGLEARNTAKIVDSVLWAEDEPQLIDEEMQEAIENSLVSYISVAAVKFETDGSRDGTIGRFERADRAKPGVAQATDIQSGRWRWELRLVPVSVAGLLADLWGRSNSVVLTSATLRAGGDFSYLIGRLGLGSAETSVIDSPFADLDRRHLVLLTDYLPSPRGQMIDSFLEAEAAEIPRLCMASDGGALVLMTARARLDRVRDFARNQAREPLERQGIRLLAQGDAGSQELVEEMNDDTRVSLLGLKSFWEGVDVPGDALRLLIVEKIPFDPLGEPLVSARMELLERRGRDPFDEYLVPRAAIAFAQGTGRLIRSETDTGVTVMLDNRMRRPLPYVDKLKRGLAGPPTVRGADSPDETYRSICAQLDLPFDEDLRERIASLPEVETLSRKVLHVGDPEEPLNDAEINRRLEIAKEWLGFDEWRPGQLNVMRRFMRGEDVIAVLPTGSGKSVTYQVPALVSPGVTLVVSPLIALMRDQVDNLRSRGVTEVAALYSGVGQSEQESVLRAAEQGHVKLLYISPERLWSPTLHAWLTEVDVARIAVDEAHCISLWGHSFRPEYAMIPKAVAAVTASSRLPVAALTATATPEVLDDIARLLDVPEATEPLIGSVDRPEIRYYCEQCDDRQDRDLKVAQIVEAFRGRSAIVYVPARTDTVRLSALLSTLGHTAKPYHGAMALEHRQYVEDAFRHDEVNVVVATKAFGLGIDKPDIELIVHLEMPASIEEYVQETGRAARGAHDGTGPATGTAVLLTMPNDCRIHRFFVDSSVPDIAAIKDVWAQLNDGMNFIDPDEHVQHIDSDSGDSDQAMGLALHYLEQIGAVSRHHDFVLRGRVILMDSAAERLPEIAAVHPALVETAERILELIDEESGEYRGFRWSAELGMKPSQVEEALFELHRAGLCGFSAWNYGYTFERASRGEPDWGGLNELLKSRRAHVAKRAKRARDFARRRSSCRRHDMLRYLGEAAQRGRACGACDACAPNLPRPWQGLTVSAVEATEAVREDAEAVALTLIDGVEGGQWSRTNLLKTLLGRSGGPHALHERLRSHGCFGRLSLLGEQEVQDLIDRLIDGAWVEDVEPAGRDYKTLRLTGEGRRRLRGIVP